MCRRTLLPALIGVAWLAGSLSTAIAADTPLAGYVAEHERIDAEYGVAKERCDHYAGNAKDVCLTEARASEARAKAAAKLTRQQAEARGDARPDGVPDRCAAMAGDAKERCLARSAANGGSR